MNHDQFMEALYQVHKCWYIPVQVPERREPKITVFLGRQDYAELLRDTGLAGHLKGPNEIFGHPVYVVNTDRYIKVIAE